MMQAADTPWMARPSIRNGVDMAPVGVRAIISAPTMLRMKPRFMMRTRPMRSARPPITTMNIPENRDVMATAMFIRLASMPRSFCMSGAMLSVVWANSQNAITPMIMPNSSLSLPLKATAWLLPAEAATVLMCESPRFGFRQGARSGRTPRGHRANKAVERRGRWLRFGRWLMASEGLLS